MKPLEKKKKTWWKWGTSAPKAYSLSDYHKEVATETRVWHLTSSLLRVQWATWQNPTTGCSLKHHAEIIGQRMCSETCSFLYFYAYICNVFSKGTKRPSWTRIPSSPRRTLKELFGHFAKFAERLWKWAKCSAFKVRLNGFLWATFPVNSLNDCFYWRSWSCWSNTNPYEDVCKWTLS